MSVTESLIIVGSIIWLIGFLIHVIPDDPLYRDVFIAHLLALGGMILGLATFVATAAALNITGPVAAICGTIVFSTSGLVVGFEVARTSLATDNKTTNSW